MKTVLATGVFDLLHPGHVLYLEEARKLGDRLVVIVARDETVGQRKKRTVIPEKQRLAVVKALKPVDEAVLGDVEDFYAPVQRIDPDVIALGKDQHFDVEELEEELKKRGLKARVVRLESYWESDLDSSRKIVERIQKS